MISMWCAKPGGNWANKTSMKRTLFFLAALLPFFAAAQKDSLVIASQTYYYQLPTDWIVDMKDDSITKSGNWNLSIRHPVRNECAYATILVGISPRNFEQVKTKQKKDKSLQDVWVNDSAEFPHVHLNYAGPASNCRSRHYRKLIDIYYLNDTALLSIAFVFTTAEAQADSMIHLYETFSDSFLSLNNNALSAFSAFKELTVNATEFTVKSGKKDLQMWYPEHWKQEIISGKIVFTGPDQTRITVATNTTVRINTDNLFAYIEDGGPRIEEEYLFGYKVYSAFTSDFKGAGKPFTGTLTYYYSYEDPELGKKTIAFSLAVKSESWILYKFYKTLLQTFTIQFLSINQF